MVRWAVSSVLFSLALEGLLLLPQVICVGDAAGAGIIAEQLGLTTSTSFPLPSQTEDAASFIKDKWSLKGSINFGEKSLAFVNDPFGNSGTGASDTDSSSASVVLSVTYNAGTYSHGTGGADFYSTFGNGQEFEAMLLSYDIAFDADFDWVKGGKLPGLRGGPKTDSCSGGNEPTGTDCFSSRLMWRTDGDGEVYAYMPQQESLCSEEAVVCNSDYGFSLGRGKFKFTAGQWQTVAVYAKMNNPPTESNGEVALYFDGQQAYSYNNLKFRTSDAVKPGGMYFSTFFGGNDKSYATPKTVHTYYRNFQLFGGAGSSSGGGGGTGAGQPESSSTSTSVALEQSSNASAESPTTTSSSQGEETKSTSDS